MAYTFDELKTAYTNANAGIAPDAATSLALDAYATQNKTGGISDATALANTYKLVNGTTAVAVETYQFFAGTAPSEAGLQFLGAALNGPTYKDFNQESRFINLAITLAIGTDAAPAFAAAYGGQGVTYQNTVATAYDKIIGNSVAAAAGVDVAETVKYLSRAENISALTQFVKANVPGLTDAQVDLAVKAALIGEILNIAVESGLGAYASSTQKLIADLGDDGHLAAGPGAADLFASYPVTPPSPPEAHTLVLANGPDALAGGDGDDTFVASETTLSSADVLDGGKGIDTLRYASSGEAPANESGFSAKSIEKVSVTSDAADGTTFDVTGVSDLTTIINDNSSKNVTFSGVGAPVALELSNVSDGNTVVTYKAAIVSGAADVQKITLNNNVQNDGTAIGTVTVNGVETFDVTSTGSVSKLAGLASTSLSKVIVAGDAALDLGNVNFKGTTAGSATVAGNTLDASTFTGALTATVNSDAIEVAVKGGAGDDRVVFAGYDKLDSFDGGAGTDTLALTNAVATDPDAAGTIANVEVLAITGGTGSGTLSLASFAGVSQVTYEGGIAANVTVKDTGAAATVVVDNVDTVAKNLTLDLKADGAADAAKIQLNGIGDADAFGVITTADANSDFETVNLVVRDDATVDGVGKVTVTNLVTAAAADQFATKLTIDSDVGLTVAAATTTATSGTDVKGLSVVDASASTGNLDLSKLAFQAVTSGPGKLGAVITLGSGDDKVTAGNGADTITLGAGKDTVVYNNVAQSSAASVDTITDFVSGTDKIDLANLGTGLKALDQFVGNYASFGAAQGALTALGAGKPSAVFESGANTLWVDVDGNGTLDSHDLQVVLSGVTKLTAADLSLKELTGNTVTLKVAASTVDTTPPPTPAIDTRPGQTTAYDDTVITSIANLAGSTLNGGANLTGGDTLKITNAGAVAIANTVTNFENLVLADGTNTVSAAAASTIKSITGGAGNDTVTITDFAAGGKIDLGAGDDALTAVTDAFVNAADASFKGGAGTDTFTFTDGETIAANLTTKVSGFEVLNLGQVGGTSAVTIGASGWTTLAADTTTGEVTFTGTGAQLSAVTTFTNTTGTEAFNLTVSDAGATFDLTTATFGGANNIDVITFANTGENVLKVTAAQLGTPIAGTVVAAGATDTLELGTAGTNTVDATKFAAFETIKASTGTAAVDITDAGVAVARTIVGNAGANVISVLGATAAKTVDIASGGVDTIQISHDASAVTTIKGFTAGAGGDVIDILSAADGALSVTTNAGIVITGASVATAATNPTNAYVLGLASTQVASGALTATGDAGAVEAAIVNAGLVHAAGGAAGEKFIVGLDDGVDTGIYVVTLVGAGNTANHVMTAADFSVSLVGVLSGVADAGTLVASNLI